MFRQRVRSFFRHRPEGQSFLRDVSYYTFGAMTWVPVVICFNGFIGEVTTIVGASMYPFLNTDYNHNQSRDLCWMNKWYPNRNVERGMIVAFRSPTHPEVIATKRVIATAGDKVITRAPCPVHMVDIPANHIWVEGDNKDGRKSLDSNHYGPIPLSLVVGKVTHIILPWKSSGAIRWQDFRLPSNRVIKGQRENALGWD